MTEEKKKLLADITEAFLNKGFYKTTMDDIASELRISKKTIYKFFPTKEALVNMIIHGIVFTVRNEFKQVINQDKSSIEKIIAVSGLFIARASKTNVNTILEIKKLGPQFWNTIEKLRAKEINANFRKLIEQGQREGYIVPVSVEIIIAVFIASIQAVINPDFIINNSFSMKQAGEMLLELFFNGILTDEGKALFKKLKQLRYEKSF